MHYANWVPGGLQLVDLHEESFECLHSCVQIFFDWFAARVFSNHIFLKKILRQESLKGAQAKNL